MRKKTELAPGLLDGIDLTERLSGINLPTDKCHFETWLDGAWAPQPMPTTGLI